jgi:ectoine hydroxylase-related dioxygenase (phytanoyl-CoA dioxygenase family)
VATTPAQFIVSTAAEGQRALEDLGLCVLPSVLSGGDASNLRELALTLATERRQGGLWNGTAESVQKVPMLINAGREFATLATHDALWPLLEHVLGPDFLLSNFSASIAHPLKSDPPHDSERTLHHDEGYVTTPAPPYAVTAVAMWPLDDFTANNGATRVVARSHREGRLPTGNDDQQSVPVEAPSGSVIVWDGRLFHRTGDNITDRSRVAVLAYYCRPWIRTQVNLLASDLEWEVTANASPRLQVLLGLKKFGTLGTIHSATGLRNI